MTRILLLTVVVVASMTPLRAQTPVIADQQLLAFVKEIQSQQAQITENQAKIEEKLASIAEAVRVARIYSSRSGH
jgi:hypothetical protein